MSKKCPSFILSERQKTGRLASALRWPTFLNLQPEANPLGFGFACIGAKFQSKGRNTAREKDSNRAPLIGGITIVKVY
jgi:hypothetical protein